MSSPKLILLLLVHLIWSAGTPLFLSGKGLSFWIVSGIRLSSSIVEELLITSVVNRVVDVRITLNITNGSRTDICVHVSNYSVASPNIILWRHYIIADVTEHLINLAQILLLHLSVQFSPTSVHRLILIDSRNAIIIFSIRIHCLSYLGLARVFIIILVNSFFWGLSIIWGRVSSFFVQIYIVFVDV